MAKLVGRTKRPTRKPDPVDWDLVARGGWFEFTDIRNIRVFRGRCFTAARRRGLKTEVRKTDDKSVKVRFFKEK